MEIHKLSFIDYAWRMIIYNDCWKVSSNFIFEIGGDFLLILKNFIIIIVFIAGEFVDICNLLCNLVYLEVIL